MRKSPIAVADTVFSVKVIFAILMLAEILAATYIYSGKPVLGDYYEPSNIIGLLVPFVISLVSLIFWLKLCIFSANDNERVRITSGFIVAKSVVWLVLAFNIIATLSFGYASVHYDNPPTFAFALTLLPLEPLIAAYTAKYGRTDYRILGVYSILGLLRGITGHLIFVSFLILLTSKRRQSIIYVLALLFLAPLSFEIIDNIRAFVRGDQVLTGDFFSRIVSRLAMTPIADYSITNAVSFFVCPGLEATGWIKELLFSIVPRSLFGISDLQTIHQCIAITASGSTETDMTFSTTLAVKLIVYYINDVAQGLLMTLIVLAIIFYMLKLAKLLFRSRAVIFVAPVLYQFLLSGVFRDILLPVYFLMLVSFLEKYLKLALIDSNGSTGSLRS